MSPWTDSAELVTLLVTAGFAGGVGVHQLFGFLARDGAAARRWAFLLSVTIFAWCAVRLLMVVQGAENPARAVQWAAVQAAVLAFVILGQVGVAGALRRVEVAPRRVFFALAALLAACMGLFGFVRTPVEAVVWQPGRGGSLWLMVDPGLGGLAGLVVLTSATVAGCMFLLRRQPRDGGLRMLVGLGTVAWAVTLVHDTALSAGLFRSMPVNQYGLIVLCLAVSAAVDLAVADRGPASGNDQLVGALERQRQQLAERNRLLADALHDVREAQEAREGFLARMSHELRTPLHAITGMTELALETSLDATQRRYIDQAHASAVELSRFVEQALDLSASGPSLVPQAVRLRPFLEDTLQLVAPRATTKGLEVVLDAPDDLPAMLVVDPIRLRQVLLNLLQNAVKFTASGEVTLVARTTRAMHGRVGICFEVHDTGPGIAPGDQARVFEPFEQAVNGAGAEGVGLGLAIARELVERLGGSLSLESELGEGTRFSFELLLSEPDVAEEIARVEPLGLQGLRVVVGYQSQAAGHLLARELTSLRMMPQAVPAGTDLIDVLARAYAEARPFGLLVLDLESRDGPGWDTLRAVGQRKDLVPAVVALVPMGAPSGAFEEGLRLGAFAVLARPLRQAELHQTLMEAVGQTLTGDELDDHTEPSVTTMPSDEDLRVLVADDHPVNRELLRALLEREGCRVWEAGDGHEALASIAHARVSGRPFHLVLMDVRMPRLDGDDATRRLRAGEAAAGLERTTVVALTAHAVHGARASLLDAGMDAVLSKPLERHALYEILDRYRAPGFEPGHKVLAQPPPIRPAPGTDELAGLRAADDEPVDAFLDEPTAPPRFLAPGRGRPAPSSAPASSTAASSTAASSTAASSTAASSTAASSTAAASAVPPASSSRTSSMSSPRAPDLPEAVSADAGGALDMPRLMELVDNDGELLRELVVVFLEALPEHEDALNSAFSAGETSAVARAAHTLRGAAGNVGALRLHQSATSIELAARDGDMAMARLEYPRLRGEVVAARRALADLVTSLDG